MLVAGRANCRTAVNFPAAQIALGCMRRGEVTSLNTGFRDEYKFTDRLLAIAVA